MAQTGDNVIAFPKAPPIRPAALTATEGRFLDDISRLSKDERTMVFALMRIQAILNDTLASLGGSQ